ncbi:MAG: hypothetical protein ACO4AI_01330, partial [Prochlorothrix sp.]
MPTTKSGLWHVAKPPATINRGTRAQHSRIFTHAVLGFAMISTLLQLVLGQFIRLGDGLRPSAIHPTLQMHRVPGVAPHGSGQRSLCTPRLRTVLDRVV